MHIFALYFTLGAFALDFLYMFDLSDFLLAAALPLIGGGGAELLSLDSDEFLLAVHFHLDVLLMLAVELCLLFLVAQFADVVVFVADLLVLHLVGEREGSGGLLLARLVEHQ
jgi:hypothetical protein